MKIGDKIVCINNKFGGAGLTINKLYIIEDIIEYKDRYTLIEIINDGCFIDKYWSWRFINERKEKLIRLNNVC